MSTIIEKWAVCQDKNTGDYYIMPENVAKTYSLWNIISLYNTVFLAYAARRILKDGGTLDECL